MIKRVVFAAVGVVGLVITFRALPGAWAVIKPVIVLGIGVAMAGWGIIAAIFPEDEEARQEKVFNWGG